MAIIQAAIINLNNNTSSSLFLFYSLFSNHLNQLGNMFVSYNYHSNTFRHAHQPPCFKMGVEGKTLAAIYGLRQAEA